MSSFLRGYIPFIPLGEETDGWGSIHHFFFNSWTEYFAKRVREYLWSFTWDISRLFSYFVWHARDREIIKWPEARWKVFDTWRKRHKKLFSYIKLWSLESIFRIWTSSAFFSQMPFLSIEFEFPMRKRRGGRENEYGIYRIASTSSHPSITLKTDREPSQR